jgi:hypothetical protein
MFNYRSAVYLLMAAVGMIAATVADGQERRPQQRHEIGGVVKSVDATAGTITIAVPVGGREREREPAMEEKSFSLAKDVEVAVGASAGRAGGLFKEAKVADLAAGTRVALTLSADQKTVESILAEPPIVRGTVKSVDGSKNSLTIATPTQRGRGEEGPANEEKTYTLTKDAEVAVDDGRGSRFFSIKEAKLTDLAQGSIVTARLTLDQKQIQWVLAEGPSYMGTIKAIDAAKKTLTLVGRPPRGDDAGEEHALTLATDAVVLIDDGRGRRLSVKPGKLADVQVGSAAVVKLSVDQSLVMFLRAEGATVTGQLKGVDADKGIITIAIPKGRGEEPEEKSYPLAKDARIMIDGAESTLADLKIGDNPPIVQLRLGLDQKTVQAVNAHQVRSR